MALTFLLWLVAYSVCQDWLGHHCQDEGHLCGEGPQTREEEAQKSGDTSCQKGCSGWGSCPRGGRCSACTGKPGCRTMSLSVRPSAMWPGVGVNWGDCPIGLVSHVVEGSLGCFFPSVHLIVFEGLSFAHLSPGSLSLVLVLFCVSLLEYCVCVCAYAKFETL